MVVPSPKIDSRDLDAVLREIRTLAPFYTHEWAAAQETGAGAALLQVAAKLLDGLIRRLNEVPMRNFIAFLDMLGIKLLPAQPARAPLTFFLSTGATEAVVIPPRSQAATNPPDGGEPLVFETEQSILATPAKLMDAYNVRVLDDSIYQAPSGFVAGKRSSSLTARLVSNALEGDTALFLDNATGLGAGDLIRIDGPKVEFGEVAKVSDTKVNLTDKLSAAHAPGAAIEKVTVFGLFAGKNRQEHGLYLGHKDLFNLKGEATIALIPSPFAKELANSNLVTWEYWGASTKKAAAGKDAGAATAEKIDWHPLVPQVGKDRIKLAKKNTNGELTGEIKEREINGIKSRWIRCTVHPALISTAQDIEIDKIQAAVTPLAKAGGIAPDMAFYNDAPLDQTKPFYPFGTRPRLFDTFYLASQEAFSKKGALITTEYQIINQPDEPKPSADATLSWEYWNGAGWIALPGLQDATNKLSTTGTIKFTCPNDMGSVAVIGQENYWIRARLTNGDYGKEEFTVDREGHVTSQPKFYPPLVERLRIKYDYDVNPSRLEVCLTFNNLAYQDHTELSSRGGSLFKPFVPMDDKNQALYLGFDQAPLKGPISVFFSLVEQEYTEKNLPRIEWEYFRKRDGDQQGEWAHLGIVDGAKNLTESGAIEFIGPPDFAQLARFGQLLYWVRAVDVADKFQPPQVTIPAAGEQSTEPPPSPCGTLKPCEEMLEVIHPSFSLGRQALEKPAAPLIKGIYLNTAWAIQAETIKDEILGSGTGVAGQKFTLAKFPVIAEEIRINEFGTLSEGERTALAQQKGVDIDQVKDEKGNVTEFWIRWRPLDDLADAAATDRVYAIDRTFGQIQFGDGVHGMAPPIGRDSIRATYQAGGSARGNVAALQITDLRTTIPLVDNVANPEPAGGGTDTELLSRALERGPQLIKNRGRAVTVEDYEWMARESSRDIARVKCLPTFNDEGAFETDWVTVIIVPESKQVRPLPSPQLRHRLEAYLRDRCPNVVSSPEHVKVTGPTYVEVRVTADLFPITLDLAPQVETEALRRLVQFLHPLTGGYQGRGWEFGRLPCLSDFYTILESVAGVDHVENLSMALRAVSPTGVVGAEPKLVTEDRPVAVSMPEYALIYSGDHKLTVKALR